MDNRSSVAASEDRIAALMARQPVKVPQTKAYGCGVKYSS